MIPVVICWSGGKDSALTLEALQNGSPFQPIALLTTFTRGVDRVSMHGVRRELILAQAATIGLPLHEAFIPPRASNDDYEAAMSDALLRLKGKGISTIAFGDLFLADIRAYRERLMQKLGLTPIFPIWGRNTRQLADDFVARGFCAKLCCVDTRVLPASFAGRDLNEDLLRELPATADPCGENGEFHSFVYEAPYFRMPIRIEVGAERRDEPFVFRDLLPTSPFPP